MIAVCHTFWIEGVLASDAEKLQEMCRRPGIVARTAILNRRLSPTGIITMVEYCDAEIAVSNPGAMINLASLYLNETGKTLTYKEVT